MQDYVFRQQTPNVIIVDNFLKNPDEVRNLALQQQFIEHPTAHKGKRTETQHLMPYVKEEFQRLLGCPIVGWTDRYQTNGVFQMCPSGTTIVYHSDVQSYAAAIYLTPDAPPECGLSLFRSKATGVYSAPTEADATVRGVSIEQLSKDTYDGKLLDRTAWTKIDQIGNVFNRLVLWNARLIHSATDYFGTDDPAKCRLFQMFFFDIDKPAA